MSLIEPLGLRVVIKPTRRTQTASGLFIPETGKAPESGEVVAVGPGEMTPYGTFITPTLRVGQRVLFQRYAGTAVGEGEDALIVLAERDILARLSPDVDA